MKQQRILGLKISYILTALIFSLLRAISLSLYHSDQNLRHWFRLFVFAGRFLFYFLVFCVFLLALEFVFLHARVFFRNTLGKRKVLPDYFWLAAAWLPLVILKYPAAMNYDTWVMLHDYRTNALTEFQSVFYSLVIGGCVGIAEKAGMTNLGLFVLNIAQYLLCVLVFGYTFTVLRKMKVSPLMQWIAFFIYILNPYIIGYIGVLIKDMPYSVLMLGITALLIDWEIDPETFFQTRPKVFFLVISLIGSILIRKNGVYLTAVLVLVTGIGFLVKKSGKSMLIVLLVSLILGEVMLKGLSFATHASPGTIREALSLPFQQTARYVREFGDTIPTEEREAIDAVLDYDRLPRIYNPMISDPVKRTYKEDSSKLPAYFAVWFRQFLKHPKCYVMATMEQNYYLFMPEIQNLAIFKDFESGYENGESIYMPYHDFYEYLFSVPETLGMIQSWFVKEVQFLHRMPILGMLGNTSFWTYLLFFILVIAAGQKCRWLYTSIPMIVAFGFVILGPTIQGHPRYMFPIIFSLPLYALYMISQKQQEKQ